MNKLEAALYYAEKLKMAIFPVNYIREDGSCSCWHGDRCAHKGKHPMSHLAPNGHTNASTDPIKVIEWWGKEPQANIGLTTGYISGVIVLDCDKEEGRKFLQERDDNGEIPQTWRVRTGGGGYHIYFKHPQTRVPNSSNDISKNVDVRGDGGYVLVPPSNHASGNLYEWVLSPPNAPQSDSAYTLEIPSDATPWLMEHVHKKQESHSRPISDEIPKGLRDDTLTRIAGILLKRGLDEESVRLALHAENRIKCKPPLSENQVNKIVKSSRNWDQGRVPLGSIEIAKIEIKDRQELKDIPPPEFLIDGIITREGLSTIYGDPGVGKSFMAIDMGLCVATGTPFHGHEVKQGQVIYLAAEGYSGLNPRITAWEQFNKVETAPPRVFGSIGNAVQLLDEDQREALLDAIYNWYAPPVLVIIDTLARSMVGGEENSAKDVGMAMQAAELIKRSTNANVMMIHHAGKDGSVRGSTALSGAVDTMLRMRVLENEDEEDDSEVIEFTCEKQKDFEEFKPIHFELAVQEIEELRASCILHQVERPSRKTPSGGTTADPYKTKGKGLHERGGF